MPSITSSTAKSSTTRSPQLPIATMPTEPEPTIKTPIDVPTAPSVPPDTASGSTSSKPATSKPATSKSATFISDRPTTSISPTKIVPSSTTSGRPQASPKPNVEAPQTSVSLKVSEIKSTKTSTITDRPESTLSSALALTVTNPANGKISLSTPAVVTIFSTSTKADGDFLTFTHIVANPTGNNDGNQVLKNTGFLSNHGAVAGVFVVVGILATTLVLFFAFLFRRRRRLNRRKRWLAGMHQQGQPTPSNPFDDPRDPPPNNPIGINNQLDWESGGPTRQVPQQSLISQRHIGLGLVDLGVDVHPTNFQTHDLNDSHHDHTGAFFSDDKDATYSRASAQSSPSIYPPSLPPAGNDKDLDNVVWHSDFGMPRPQQNFPIADAPPRPPRSLLRRNSTKSPEVYPLTPPASVSSHSNSKPPSPITDSSQLKGPQDIFNRRTLLDVRPRSGRDPVVGFE